MPEAPFALIGKRTLAYSGGVADDLFKALADGTRRTILDELTEKSGQTLFEICSRLSMRHELGISRQAVSQHLAVLEAAGLVETRREGRYKFHDLNVAPLRHITERWLDPLPPHRRRTPHEDPPDQRLRRRPGGGPALLHRRPRLREEARRPGGRDGPVAHRHLTRGAGRHRAAARAVPPPAVKPYRDALVADGIPLAAFAVDDVRAEYERLRERGVRFTQEPLEMGPVTTAVFDDTCGNLIQIASQA